MQTKRKALWSLAMTILIAGSSVHSVQAQPASTPTAASKAEAKAERKAQRKQARAAKNAELKKLQSNGYSAQSPQEDYPQNLQRAESKAAGATAASAAAKTVPPPGSGQ
ncbi:DUF4148 domain-containing protein [Paraburkholderia fungorum]|uniref:DUF4148 domain-containing protein n=1 Tax=Paraburkholderia fungorum TaxID=134537 RepID=UPI00402BF330